MHRLNVLLSAYACEPGRGSEPGVGWNVARGLAAHHNVWVLTRANNRRVIEAELAARPVPGLRVAYYDLPPWMRWWKRGARGIQLYYHLWQLGVWRRAKALHDEIDFDLVHHVTFVRYWTPSLLAFLDAPFVWGPVGGAESLPSAFASDLSWRAAAYERIRDAARFVGEHDPLVRQTARRAALALATTPETASRLRRLGAARVEMLGESGLNSRELRSLQALAVPKAPPARFISVGRLLHWKGFHLGLRAFAAARLQDAEYWVVGDGPERSRLEALTSALGIRDQVRFFGHRPRAETLELLEQSHVLVHPSLHDSGGWVCLEAMAAGRPVVCLNIGGPATQVTPQTGIIVPAGSPQQVHSHLVAAFRRLATTPLLRDQLGQRGRRHVETSFSWDAKTRHLAKLYERLALSTKSDVESGVGSSIASQKGTADDGGPRRTVPQRGTVLDDPLSEGAPLEGVSSGSASLESTPLEDASASSK